jgi:large repetitive protein
MFAYLCHDRPVRWAALAAAMLLFTTLLVLVAGASPTVAGQDLTEAGPQQPPDPYLLLQVNYGHDWVEGQYEADHTLWLTVTDDAGAVKATAELQTQQIPWWSPGQTGFSTNLGSPWSPSRPDMQAGDWLYGRVDNGRTAEVHLGEITGNLDIDNDTITGNLYAGWLSPPVTLWCNVWETDGPSLDALWVDPDGGSYFCDFGAAGWDLMPGHDVGVTYREPDGDEVINVFMEPAPNLGIEKWPAGSDQAFPGGPVVFGMRVQNHGNAAASQVIVTDTLPANASYIGDSSGVMPSVVGNEVVWDLGSLDVDEEIRFYLYLENTASADDTVHNEADAWTLYDQDTNDNHAEADVQVVDELPDLNVYKHPETGNPAAGETMLWRLDYGNNGPVASGPAVLTDTLPVGTTVVEWWSENGLGWNEVASNGQLILEVPSVPGYWGDQLYVRLELDPGLASGDQLTNTIEITATSDSDPGNNWAQRDDVWVGDKYWNASVGKNFGWGILVPGGEVEYHVNVRNNGNAAASLVLTDVLPAGTSLVSAWRQQGPTSVPFPPDSVAGGLAVWNLGTMEPGDWMDLQVRLAIAADTPVDSLLENCARVAMDHDDAWPMDNESCRVVGVNAPGPNLAIEKTYNWNWEGQLQYTINVWNVGTVELSDVVLSDTIPANTTFNGNWWHSFWEQLDLTLVSPGQLEWTFNRLEPSWSAGLSFQLDLDPGIIGQGGLSFVNIAQADIPGDVVPEDNMDAVTAYTGPDLYIEKTHSSGEPAPGGLITYTVEFGNANGWPWGTAANTHLTDTLPAAMTFVTATAPWDPGDRWHPEMVDGGTVVWGWGNMDPNNTWFFDLVVEIDPEAPHGAVLVNTIEVGSDNPEQDQEYDYSNNTAEATVSVMAGYHIYLPTIFRGY